MTKSDPIPTWELSEMSYQHFGRSPNPPLLTEVHQLFHVNKIEDYKAHLQIPMLPHRNPVYSFLFLTKGVVRCSKGLNPYEIRENIFWFLPAYQITQHEFMSVDTEGYYCHFNFDIFTNHLPQHNILRDFPFLQFTSYPIVQVDEASLSFLIPIFKRLEVEYLKQKEINFDIITAYLFTLFTEIKPFYTPSVTEKKNSALTITQQFKDALSRHIYDKQKVAEYAELLCISPNHLNKCVKSATGQSAHDILYEMILLEAKVLLRQTDMPINEIAYKLTQQDHSVFSRFFKSQTGMTPKEFKLK